MAADLNILIIGSGAREHALAWKISQSPRVAQIWVAPGNAGTAQEPRVKNCPMAVTDLPSILKVIEFALHNAVDLTLVGPEQPLALGIVDAFHAAGLACFGPTQQAARLESSKAFAKQLLEACNIPTASYHLFSDLSAAEAHLKTCPLPTVIKADGLAAGKGVVVAKTREEALAALSILQDLPPSKGDDPTLIVEAFIEGQELSFIALVDGEHILPLASSQDHKQRDDGGQGPNTGGMGAISPAPQCTPELEATIVNTIFKPIVQALANRNTPYCGFLYAGLMIDSAGTPYVLEFNCRLGDPETQPILMRLESDLVDLIQSALNGTLQHATASWDPRPAIGVVMASGGYPEEYRQGDVIQGLHTHTPETKIFHAGTALQQDQIVTAGGRVLTVTALADSTEKTRQKAYAMAETLHWPDCFYRRDIGSC